MYFIVRNAKTNRMVGYRHGCNGCKNLSPLSKGDKLPAGWVEKLEPQRTPTGRIKRRGGHVMNYYCKSCQTPESSDAPC